MPAYRIVFRPELRDKLRAFSKIHEFDALSDYKEAWTEWCETHEEDLTTEYEHVRRQGVECSFDDMVHRLYTSARYYHRKLPTNPPPPKSRNVYVRISSSLLDAIRDHIQYELDYGYHKPSMAFKSFYEENEPHIRQEIKRIQETQTLLTKNEFSQKLKKAYKNMYFMLAKKNAKKP